MEKRTLGRSGIEISALGMGCWAIGGPFWAGQEAVGWGGVDDDESVRAVHTALECGVTFFDTADVYGCGHSERVLARALAGRREQVVIGTKFGNSFNEDSKQIIGTDASPEYIRLACEKSLERLGTDYIDLYQFHLNDYPADKAVEVRETLEALVQEGKIRHYAWSTDFVDRAEVFAKGAHCVAIQHQLNVLDDNPAMIAFCEQEGLASINRGPLAMGLLTGKYSTASALPQDDVRGKNSPDWMRYFRHGSPNEALLKQIAAIRDILTSSGRTLAQGAIAWLWRRSKQTIPIPGIRTEGQAQENGSALALVPLRADEMGQIATILSE